MDARDPDMKKELDATLQARKDLGPEYEAALVESFLARVDGQISRQVRREVAWAERDTAREVAPRKGKKFRRHGNFLPVASLVFAIPLSAIGAVNDQLAGLLVTWAGIVGVNVASAWSQRHADARHDRDDRDRDLDRWE